MALYCVLLLPGGTVVYMFIPLPLDGNAILLAVWSSTASSTLFSLRGVLLVVSPVFSAIPSLYFYMNVTSKPHHVWKNWAYYHPPKGSPSKISSAAWPGQCDLSHDVIRNWSTQFFSAHLTHLGFLCTCIQSNPLRCFIFDKDRVASKRWHVIASGHYHRFDCEIRPVIMVMCISNQLL